MRWHEIEPLLATRRDLSAAQEQQVRAHLAGCPACAAAWQREQRTTRALQRLRAPAAIPAPRQFVPPETRRRSPLRSQGHARLALGGLALALLLALLATQSTLRSALGWPTPATGGLSTSTATPAPGEVADPALLLYQRQGAGGDELWMIDDNGGNDHQVLTCPDGCSVRAAALAPQGDAVVYLSATEGEESQTQVALRVAKTDGSDDRILLAEGSENNITSLAISPEGQHVAFLRYRPQEGRGAWGEEVSLWVVPLAGGEAFQLGPWRPYLGDPYWFDSQHLLYTALMPSEGEQIFKHAIGEDGQAELISAGRLQGLSPDRSRIIVLPDPPAVNQQILRHISNIFDEDGDVDCTHDMAGTPLAEQEKASSEQVWCGYDGYGRLAMATLKRPMSARGQEYSGNQLEEVQELYHYNRAGWLDATNPSATDSQGWHTSLEAEHFPHLLMPIDGSPRENTLRFDMPVGPVSWAHDERHFALQSRWELWVYELTPDMGQLSGRSFTPVVSDDDQPPGQGDESQQPDGKGAQPDDNQPGRGSSWVLNGGPLLWAADGSALLYLGLACTPAAEPPLDTGPHGGYCGGRQETLELQLLRFKLADESVQTLTTFRSYPSVLRLGR